MKFTFFVDKNADIDSAEENVNMYTGVRKTNAEISVATGIPEDIITTTLEKHKGYKDLLKNFIEEKYKDFDPESAIENLKKEVMPQWNKNIEKIEKITGKKFDDFKVRISVYAAGIEWGKAEIYFNINDPEHDPFHQFSWLVLLGHLHCQAKNHGYKQNENTHIACWMACCLIDFEINKRDFKTKMDKADFEILKYLFDNRENMENYFWHADAHIMSNQVKQEPGIGNIFELMKNYK